MSNLHYTISTLCLDTANSSSSQTSVWAAQPSLLEQITLYSDYNPNEVNFDDLRFEHLDRISDVVHHLRKQAKANSLNP